MSWINLSELDYFDIITELIMLIASILIFIATWRLYRAYKKKEWLFPTLSIVLFVLAAAIDLFDEFCNMPEFIESTGENYLRLLGISLFALGILATAKHLVLMANSDPLTGQFNRRFFLELLRNQVERARVDNKVFVIVFIDIDGFREINDTMGHTIGDVVLLDVALKLKETIRTGDTVARFGGDEFTILLPDTDLNGAEELLVTLKKAVANMKIAGGPRIGLSVGLAQFPEDTGDSDRLIAVASRKMIESRHKAV